MRRMSRPIHIPLRVEERLATAHGGARYVLEGICSLLQRENHDEILFGTTPFSTLTRAAWLSTSTWKPGKHVHTLGLLSGTMIACRQSESC